MDIWDLYVVRVAILNAFSPTLPTNNLSTIHEL